MITRMRDSCAASGKDCRVRTSVTLDILTNCDLPMPAPALHTPAHSGCARYAFPPLPFADPLTHLALRPPAPPAPQNHRCPARFRSIPQMYALRAYPPTPLAYPLQHTHTTSTGCNALQYHPAHT